MNVPSVKGKAMGFQNLVGKRVTKTLKFLGEEITIAKLTVTEVQEIQKLAKQHEGDEEGGLTVLIHVIKTAVDGAKDVKDEEFRNFPMDELARLSDEIMKFSGMGKDQPK